MRLMKCPVHGYNIKRCCAAAKSAHPPKFSPEDRYGKYRRMAKAEK